jgi:hypothetical protein
VITALTELYPSIGLDKSKFNVSGMQLYCGESERERQRETDRERETYKEIDNE